MNKKKTLILVIILALVLVGAYIAYDKLSGKVSPGPIPVPEQEETVPSGEPGGDDPADEAPGGDNESAKDPAPDFRFVDYDGNEYRLSDFRGTPVVLNFWATWCGPCRNELPEFDEASREYDGKIQFIMLDLADGVGDTVEAASGFVAENGFTFPVFYDTSLEGMQAYGINAIPVTVFIDADGNIAAKSIGSMSGDTLRQGIALIYP